MWAVGSATLGAALPISTKPRLQSPGDTSASNNSTAHTRCRALHKTPLRTGSFRYTALPAETSLPPYVWAVPRDLGSGFSRLGVSSPEPITQSRCSSPHAYTFCASVVQTGWLSPVFHNRFPLFTKRLQLCIRPVKYIITEGIYSLN